MYQVKCFSKKIRDGDLDTSTRNGDGDKRKGVLLECRIKSKLLQEMSSGRFKKKEEGGYRSFSVVPYRRSNTLVLSRGTDGRP